MKRVVRASLAAATALVAIALGAATTFGAPPAKPAPKLMTEAEILKTMKGPKDFDVTVFAMPPDVMYPTAVAATGAGDVYVAIDEQGSLGKEKGKGRVV